MAIIAPIDKPLPAAEGIADAAQQHLQTPRVVRQGFIRPFPSRQGGQREAFVGIIAAGSCDAVRRLLIIYLGAAAGV